MNFLLVPTAIDTTIILPLLKIHNLFSLEHEPLALAWVRSWAWASISIQINHLIKSVAQVDADGDGDAGGIK